MKKPTITVIIQGGVLQSVIHSQEDLEINVIDRDVEGSDIPENIKKLNLYGGTEEVYCYTGEVGDYNPHEAYSISRQINN